MEAIKNGVLSEDDKEVLKYVFADGWCNMQYNEFTKMYEFKMSHDRTIAISNDINFLLQTVVDNLRALVNIGGPKYDTCKSSDYYRRCLQEIKRQEDKKV